MTEISRRDLLKLMGGAAAGAAVLKSAGLEAKAAGVGEEKVIEAQASQFETSLTSSFYPRSQIEVRGWLRLLAGDKLPVEREASLERTAESLEPGDIAPETWGGAGLYDAVTVYVNDSEFQGQAVILRQHGGDNTTYVLVSGRNAEGKIVKGARWLFGRDSHASEDELNISLGGGGGGAQLYYEKEAKRLTFWMNGFIVGSPDEPLKGVTEELEKAIRAGKISESQYSRVTFVADALVNPDQSRVLHQPFPSEQIQYYMRAGNIPVEESGTRFLGFAHASIRVPITPFLPAENLFPILLPTIVASSGPEKFLYVVQSDSRHPGMFTSFVWRGDQEPDLAAETVLVVGYDRGEETKAVFPVPEEIHTLVNDVDRVIISSEIQPTDEYAFTAVVPEPVGEHLICLPTLETKVDGKKGLLMTQTAGVYTAFLPLVSKASK